MQIKVKILKPGARAPLRANQSAAGADLFALTPQRFEPQEPTVLQLGIALEIPYGYEGQIRGRSSLNKRGLAVSFGTIDCDYRGEVGVIITNLTNHPMTINAGDRIAQLIVAAYEPTLFAETNVLTETLRGEGGFGSTGK